MSDVFFDGITCIREELIEEAQNYVFQRRRQVWKRYAGLAAGLLLVICLGWNFLAGVPGLGSMAGGNAGASNGMSGGVSDETAPEEPGGLPLDGGMLTGGDNAAPPDGMEGQEAGYAFPEYSFTADVIEVGDGYILVVPLPGNGFWSVADRVTVPTDGTADLPEIQAGDQVQITFEGEAAADRVTGVTDITLLP